MGSLAIVPSDQKPKSFFIKKLPTELVVLVMCHTNECDLVNLIRAGKSMYGIFSMHKKSIFKRMQICQFPEFNGWFGDLPGFDGSALDCNRTPEQIQCLRDIVLRLDWRHVNPVISGAGAAGIFLNSLERYGGWRYLYFSKCVKDYLEKVMRKFQKLLRVEIPAMRGGQAKAMVLCLARVSWKSPKAESAEARAARVETRLTLFGQEPLAVQELSKWTLLHLVWRIAGRLRLADTVTLFRDCCQPLVIATPTPQQILEIFDNTASEFMVKLLLEYIFTFGVDAALELCEEPAGRDALTDRLMIERIFWNKCFYYCHCYRSGVFPNRESALKVGKLWAAGLGLPTRCWFRSNRVSRIYLSPIRQILDLEQGIP